MTSLTETAIKALERRMAASYNRELMSLSVFLNRLASEEGEGVSDRWIVTSLINQARNESLLMRRALPPMEQLKRSYS